MEREDLKEAFDSAQTKCINLANSVVGKMNPKARGMFEFDGDASSNYYDEKYGTDGE